MAHYFTNGGHLGDHAALAEIGAAAGLDRAEVTAFLASQDGAFEEVRAELAEATQLGITSVPTFVFDGAVAIQGAQSPELLLEVMTKVAAGAYHPQPPTQH